MNRFIYSLLLLMIMRVFSSCEKQVKLHPENSEQKIAIEAMFTDNPFVSYFKLSKTKSINESINGHELISDAQIKVTDKTTGDIFNYVYNASSGKYFSYATGIEGHQYKMEILAEGQYITAEQIMSSPININNIESVLDKESGKYFLNIYFDDPENQSDYYLFIFVPNDTSLESKFTVMTDLNYDRQNHSLSVPSELFDSGQDWQILTFHIDRKNYNYLHVVLRAMKSMSNGAHPFYGIALGNPPSTVHGEQAIGYWICASVSLFPVRIGN